MPYWLLKAASAEGVVEVGAIHEDRRRRGLPEQIALVLSWISADLTCDHGDPRGDLGGGSRRGTRPPRSRPRPRYEQQGRQ